MLLSFQRYIEACISIQNRHFVEELLQDAVVCMSCACFRTDLWYEAECNYLERAKLVNMYEIACKMLLFCLPSLQMILYQGKKKSVLQLGNLNMQINHNDALFSLMKTIHLIKVLSV